MKIRKATKKDINILALIDVESEFISSVQNKVGVKAFKKRLLKRFKRNEEIFLLTEKNEPIAYAGFFPKFPGHRHAELHWLAVRKKFQKLGFGKKLIKFIEMRAKKKGFRKLCLYTNEKAPARKFYKALKYREINKFPDYYGYKKGSRTAVLYCKTLQK